MKIRLTDISPQGLHIQENLSEENINARMNEGFGNDINFTAAPKVDITVSKTHSEGELTGTIAAKVKQPCSRCADEIERELKVPVKYVIKERPSSITTEEAKFLDDIGVIYHEGEHIEIEELLQESLILALSPFWSPPLTKDGHCSQCKKPCNDAGGESEKIHKPFAEVLKIIKPKR